MSAISDYASLLIDAGEYAGANDIAHVFPRLVALAEGKFNRVLRVAEMEEVMNLSLVDGSTDLPDDFLEARSVLGANGQALNAWSLQELSRRFGTHGGTPRGYAIVGNTLTARPTQTGTAIITYYAKIPALTAANPSNWLLQKAPDVYLYALVEEIAIWKKDPDGVAAGRGLKELAMKGLALQDERARWGNAQVVVAGYTP